MLDAYIGAAVELIRDGAPLRRDFLGAGFLNQPGKRTFAPGRATVADVGGDDGPFTGELPRVHALPPNAI